MPGMVGDGFVRWCEQFSEVQGPSLVILHDLLATAKAIAHDDGSICFAAYGW